MARRRLRPVNAEAILKLENLEVTLARTRILDGVNLSVGAELVWLVGRNGAGKSTLMRAVAGLLPAKGDTLIAGHSPRSLEARAQFCYVPDDPALYEDLTLTEHARFVSLAYRQPEAEARITDWFERFLLEDRVDEFPSSHSRGMRQKLSLSLALGLDVPLLMLDEPFNGLDIQAQDQLAKGLRERVRAGKAVLVTAHQGEVARSLLEGGLRARVMQLDGGQLHQIDLETGIRIEVEAQAEASA